jgi:uridine kinase
MTVVSVAAVLTAVLARPAVGGSRIVGVDGPSGAGKSTVARRLAAAWGAPVIECDDFVSWECFSSWWPRFEREVLDPLGRGMAARYGVRDWQNDELGSSLRGYRTVAWAPLVIAEGVTCTRAAAGSRLAYRIWVDAPEQLRLQRGIERDGESHRDAWLRWMGDERRFFAEDHTRDLADLVVDGAPTGPFDPDSELVVAAVSDDE